MDACCETKAEELNTLRDKHRKVLILVLAINAVLFVVEAIAGFLAHSTALLADSLDMLKRRSIFRRPWNWLVRTILTGELPGRR